MSRSDDGRAVMAGPAPDMQSGFVNNQRVDRVWTMHSGTFVARKPKSNEVS